MTSHESAMRVFYMQPQLVERWRKVRDRQDVVTREFIVEACTTHLPEIAKEAREMGLVVVPGDERVPVRLEMALSALAALADVSERTGIPSTQLLSMCLGRAAQRRRRGAKN